MAVQCDSKSVWFWRWIQGNNQDEKEARWYRRINTPTLERKIAYVSLTAEAKKIPRAEIHETAEEIMILRGNKQQIQLAVYDPKKDKAYKDLLKPIIPNCKKNDGRVRCRLCNIYLYPGNDWFPLPTLHKSGYCFTESFVMCSLCKQDPLRNGYTEQFLRELTDEVNDSFGKSTATRQELFTKGIWRKNRGWQAVRNKKWKKRVGKTDPNFVLKRLRRVEKSDHIINIEEMARSAFMKNLVFLRVRDPEDFLKDIAQQMYLIIHDAPDGQTASFYKERADKWVRRLINSGCFNPENAAFAAENKTWTHTDIKGNPEQLESDHFESCESAYTLKGVYLYDEDSTFETRSIDPASHKALCLKDMWSQVAPRRQRHFGEYLNPLCNPMIDGWLPPYLVLHNIEFSQRQLRLAQDLSSGDSFDVLANRYSPGYYDSDIFHLIDKQYLPDEYVRRLESQSKHLISVDDVCQVRASQKRARSAMDLKAAMSLSDVEKKMLSMISKQSEKLELLVVSISNIFEPQKKTGILQRHEIKMPLENDRLYWSYIADWKYLAYLFQKTSWTGLQFSTDFRSCIYQANKRKIEDPNDQIISIYIDEFGRKVRRTRSFYILAGEERKAYDSRYYLSVIYGTDPEVMDRYKTQKYVGIRFFSTLRQLSQTYRDIKLIFNSYSLPYVSVGHRLPDHIEGSDPSWYLEIACIEKWKGDSFAKHTFNNEQWCSRTHRRFIEYINKIFIVDKHGRFIKPGAPDNKINHGSFQAIESAQNRINDIKEILERKNMFATIESLWPIATENGFRYINDEGQIVEY